jgi:tRNA A58 N-methylase Trm61
MKTATRRLLCFLTSCFLILNFLHAQPATNSFYTFKEDHDPDGIGKFYQGREIAQVMGHEGADWLERPERMTEERPDLLLKAIDLKPGDAVADIGAGSGYLSWRMAKIVGNRGKVFSNDIQPEMLELLARNMAEHHTTNFQAVLGTITDSKLPPDSIHLAIMVDVYHEFDHPYEMMQSIVKSLKPGGRVVWVEYRGEDPNVPIKPLHKMTVAQVRKEAALMPLQWVRTVETLPRQHIVIFKKTAPAATKTSLP